MLFLDLDENWISLFFLSQGNVNGNVSKISDTFLNVSVPPGIDWYRLMKLHTSTVKLGRLWKTAKILYTSASSIIQPTAIAPGFSIGTRQY